VNNREKTGEAQVQNRVRRPRLALRAFDEVRAPTDGSSKDAMTAGMATGPPDNLAAEPVYKPPWKLMEKPIPLRKRRVDIVERRDHAPTYAITVCVEADFRTAGSIDEAQVTIADGIAP
jgi:hypothetical protein